MKAKLETVLAAVGMGGNALYGELRPGDRFIFPSRPEVVYVKNGGGWYHRLSLAHPDLRGRAYRTGSTTAVYKLPKDEQEGR